MQRTSFQISEQIPTRGAEWKILAMQVRRVVLTSPHHVNGLSASTLDRGTLALEFTQSADLGTPSVMPSRLNCRSNLRRQFFKAPRDTDAEPARAVSCYHLGCHVGLTDMSIGKVKQFVTGLAIAIVNQDRSGPRQHIVRVRGLDRQVVSEVLVVPNLDGCDAYGCARAGAEEHAGLDVAGVDPCLQGCDPEGVGDCRDNL
jgi:hypothetical protein